MIGISTAVSSLSQRYWSPWYDLISSFWRDICFATNERRTATSDSSGLLLIALLNTSVCHSVRRPLCFSAELYQSLRRLAACSYVKHDLPFPEHRAMASYFSIASTASRFSSVLTAYISNRVSNMLRTLSRSSS